jgi:hypothetical protein
MGKPSRVRASILVPALVLSAVGGSSFAATQAVPDKSPAVEPQAKDALGRMVDAFKSLPEFGVHQEITREQVIDGDLKVQKSSVADILVRRPDRLKADVVADDDRSHSVFYDGKTLTVYVPGKKYYAQTAVPNTLAGMIDTAESEYGIEFPTPDLMRMAAGEDFADELTAAGEVGKSNIGGVECDHYAYRNAEVDYQIWLEPGDKPLPRKIVITSKKDPTQPEYTAFLTWNLAPKLDDTSFTFTPPEGATKIPMYSLKQPAKAPAPATKPNK